MYMYNVGGGSLDCTRIILQVNTMTIETTIVGGFEGNNSHESYKL